MPKPLLEQAKLVESVNKKTGKILVDIVTPGVGSSGYYSPEVCEAAAGLVTAGTQMFIDHPTEAEEMERPIRSVKDIAAVFTESARWDPDRGEAGSLVAEAQVVPAWVETMGVIQKAIGVSLRGSATDIVEGARPDGSQGRIVEGLHAIDSVDFVTHAGRGGAFALLESAQPTRVNRRAVKHGVSEATVNDTRESLQSVLRDEYGGDKTYVWVRDFEETADGNTVWFEVESEDDNGIFAQAYAMSDTAGASLTGDRTEVQVQTKYVAVTRPDSNTPTTEADQEITMGKIQVEESVHTDALAKAGRVDALETENATLKDEKTRADVAEAALATERRTSRAMTLIREHDHRFSPLEAKGLVAELPLTESGDFDEEKFGTQLTEHAATAQVAAGAGTVTSFGQTTDTTKTTTESAAPTKTAWGRPLSENGA
ncbi:MAG: hypothetical protein ABIR39_09490 [Nocardioides sp.]|uniref:hypothetical protein n=1 Tax=Nocardioides sp. TaxID=35761 RepID=UPI0032633F45